MNSIESKKIVPMCIIDNDADMIIRPLSGVSVEEQELFRSTKLDN